MKQSMQSRGSFDGGRVVTMGFLVLAFVLTACGGGGGGAATAPVANPQAPLSIVATPILSDLNGKIDVGTSVTTVISAEFTPVNFTNSTAANFTVATGQVQLLAVTEYA